MLLFEKLVLFIAQNPANNKIGSKQRFNFLLGKDLFMSSH
jgi:hypothetical protein